MKRWRIISAFMLLAIALVGCNETESDKNEVDIFGTTEYGTYVFEGEPDIASVQSLDFGEVPLGTTASRRIEVRNNGRDTLKFGEITVTADFELQYENGQVPVELEPGEVTYLTVYYLSREELGTRGTLDIASNDPDTPIWTITIAANVKFPCVTLSTDAISFGLIDPGEVRTQSFFVENCSENAIGRVEFEAYEGDPEFAVGRLPALVLEPGDRYEVQVMFQPRRPGSFEGTLRLTTNDEMRARQEVEIKGLGRSPDCPVAVIDAVDPARGGTATANPTGTFTGLPLDRINLDASRSFDPEGGNLQYSWSMISRPTDSNSTLESGGSATAKEIWLDLAGEYVVELEVLSEEGLPACETARLTLRAVADQDIHLQLVWDTPNDPNQSDASGSDVDIHFLHPNPGGQWNAAPWDCFWMNMEPAWGPGGAEDNPSLDRDDVDGLGPENINLDNPELNKTYSLGAHYFSDHNYGDAYVTIRIYIGGVLFKEVVRKRLRDQDFWDIADIDWPGGAITDIDQVYTSFF